MKFEKLIQEIVKSSSKSSSKVINWHFPNLSKETDEYFQNRYTKDFLKSKGFVFDTKDELLSFLKKGKLIKITKNRLRSNYKNLTLTKSDFEEELRNKEYQESFKLMEKELLKENKISLPSPIVLKIGETYYGFAGNRRMNLAFKYKIPLKVWLVSS